MKLSDFDFNLPKNLIAQHPVYPRNSSRMLVISKEITDSHFNNFVNFVNINDLVIFNESKVIPAFLEGKFNNKTIELNLHKNVGNDFWLCFAKGSKHVNIGDKLIFGNNFSAIVRDKNYGELKLEFEYEGEFLEKLLAYGKLPLPPYIKNYNKNTNTDYQTIYAKDPGSVAAPTAGLHFTDEIINKLKQKADVGYLTLHVGAGTFLPVKTENISQHKMHSEEFTISDHLREKIHETKSRGGKIIAVGTTSLRALESSFDAHDKKSTDIFITPGYKFKVVDMLLTNFHLPKSTLFMLVCAFSGYNKMKSAYEHAIREQYRFFSYGDCCLLSRNEND